MADAERTGRARAVQHRICATCGCEFTPLYMCAGRLRPRRDPRVGKACSKACRSILIQRKKTKHGQTGTRLFQIWSNMRRRCGDDRNRAFLSYGARGIFVCEEWSDFSAFKAWADASGYQDDLTLERRDNDLGYSPDNCCWITNAMQQRNRRNVRLRAGDIPTIREKLRSGESLRSIAACFGVTDGMIARIRDGKNWVGA